MRCYSYVLYKIEKNGSENKNRVKAQKTNLIHSALYIILLIPLHLAPTYFDKN